MSFESEYTLTCRSCGRMFHADLVDCANVTAEPELLSRIREHRLNVVECPRCHHQSYVDKPFLYHDMDRELMLYVYPEACRSEEKELRLEIARKVVRMPHQQLLRRKTIGLLFGMERLLDLLCTLEGAARTDGFAPSM